MSSGSPNFTTNAGETQVIFIYVKLVENFVLFITKYATDSVYASIHISL